MKHAQQLLAAGFLLGLTTLTVHAGLVSKGHGIYDSNLNVIWAQDANLLNTLEGSTTASYTTLVNAIISANKNVVLDSPNYFDNDTPRHVLTASDFGSGGTVDYWGAIAFVHYLNWIHYDGSDEWALPSLPINSSLGYDQTDNPFGELFYTELSGVAGSAMPAGPFINIQSSGAGYWFRNEYAPNANYGWFFAPTYGYQFFAWPVRPANQLYSGR